MQVSGDKLLGAQARWVGGLPAPRPLSRRGQTPARFRPAAQHACLCGSEVRYDEEGADRGGGGGVGADRVSGGLAGP